MLQNLPATGFVRLRALLGDPKANPPVPAILPISSATLWRWVRKGHFPAPLKLSTHVTAWRCEDVRAWLKQHSHEQQEAA